MKNIKLITLLFSFICQILVAQNGIKIKTLDAKNNEPLVGVSVVQLGTTKGNVSDDNGIAFLQGLPTGNQTFVLSFIGYKNDTLSASFPLSDTSTIVVKMESEENDLEVITVSALRTNARIEDLPMKVEVLGLEELNEENGIKPGNISSLLGDLSVIHIQQTSSVSGGSVVRMQGLDGKYTQILRDGLPLYDGFSGGLGILQIPPLDLRQVEIIKGSVSTLYGGGAIGGMINLVTKQPSKKPEWVATFNQSTLKESNINSYFSKKMGDWGVTFFTALSSQEAVDVNGDAFSDVPKVRSILVHPRLFWGNEKSKFDIGYSGTFEQRDGGDIQALEAKSQTDSLHSFFEKYATQRNTFDGHFKHTFSKTFSLAAKSAMSLLNREILSSVVAPFSGNFGTSYSEVSILNSIDKDEKKSDFVAGVNAVTQSFSPTNSTQIAAFNYATLGVFAQETWKPLEKWTFEGGLRADNHNNFGWFVMPRLSVLFKPSHDWSVRVGGGGGYRTPDVFTDKSSGNTPLSNLAKAEVSSSYNFDGNWSHLFSNGLSLTLNQAFYFVNIDKPIVSNGSVLTNSDGSVKTLGTDTYVHLSYDEIEFYLGYNHTLAQRFDNLKPTQYVTYSPQDKIALTIAYEIEGKWRVGIESSYVANQYLNDGSKSIPYWFWAAMIERKFKHFSVVLNGENLADFRQSNSEQLYDGSRRNPAFRSLWAPIDGRVINLSLKWNIF
jgi:outer membrane receptor for ferrienterochelin and colicins